MTEPRLPNVFISYSHKDEVWKDRLVTQLSVLREQNLLTLWEDRQIGAGDDWYENIQAAMDAADVAVLLVSANSLTSEFILREEVRRLLQRRDREGLRVYPVIVEHCPWKKVAWLSRMQVRPTDGKPLSAHAGHRRAKALSDIATEIIEQFERVQTPPPRQDMRGAAAERIFTARLPVTGRELFGRERELKMLDDAWTDPGTNILSLVAWGGVGKSALVNHWLARMAREDYRGASRVYGWSFYSQGTTDRAVSADQFIEAALVFFGDEDPNRGSPWDKGERLARLVGEQRALLLLDGLEPLQNPPGPDEGKLKDQALQSLLRQLAAHNKGLCVLTTRVNASDLSPFEGGTVTRIDLDNLTPEAGTQLLRAQGVQGPDAELQQASSEFGGHSLALTLLGSYLSDVHAGDITRRSEVRGLEVDERHGRHAQRVMTSYERWFGEGPELDLLRNLGLFNRPADGGSVAALRAAPAIPGLTDHLQNLTPVKWQQLLSRLRRAGLLAAPSPAQPDTLDTHPLVREHFGRQLQTTNPDAWREGNNRLYEHLRDTTKEFPDTIEEMAPLYAAVAHGCAAGRHQEALDNVYFERIQRRNKSFNTKQLGAVSAELAVLASFFDPPWQRPVPILREDVKAYVLNEAGYDLRALGRLTEAAQPMQATAEADTESSNAAIAFGNLSELYLTLGELSQALSYAQESVELADRSGNEFQRISKRTTLADTLYHMGQLSESEAAMLEAEKMQKVAQPKFPFLYAFQGFRYCALLLHQGKYRKVQARAAQTLEWAKHHHLSLISIALDYLSLGRAYFIQAQHEATGDFIQAIEYLNQAVDGLRQAGQLDDLPRGLLARAELRRVRGEFARARDDLDEAMSIAARGSMGLYQADCHLEYARLYLARPERDEEKAREHWREAKEMIERMGYHLRDGDVREIGELLGEKADG